MMESALNVLIALNWLMINVFALQIPTNLQILSVLHVLITSYQLRMVASVQ